ncbi:mannitol dehydrogenase family protein [Roseicyclus persicicus]
MRRHPAPPVRMVHLGPGAFFRSFVAPMTEEAGGWGIMAVALASGRAREELGPQGGVYTAVELGPEGPVDRLVEVVAGVLVAAEEPGAVLAAMADPGVRVVTLTVTEKGYRPDPGDMDSPRSAAGWIVAALARRRATGVAPFTVLSCDNLAGNGHVIRDAVLGLARARDAGLADWIAAEGAFPCSMVDRITPAMTEADRAALAERTGVRDAGAVQHEPFAQWVIEDRFVGGARPAWETAGAQMVGDVAPFEAMKLRCLNGAHSALAYLGWLAGHGTVAEAAGDPVFAGYLRRLWAAEVGPSLTPPAGVSVPEYCDALLERFRNPAIRHQLRQIATDGSQKLPPRLLAPIRKRLAAGRPVPCLSLAVAGWMAHLSTDLLQDPMADRLRAVAGDPEAILRVAEVFDPALAGTPAFRTTILDAVDTLTRDGARAAVARLAQEA